ncbi:hypothetical protein ElyMa_001732600 [Elysia marginata]|uniref:G-protein coupled receptors family 1 profile domain-containing protein n=1 Tax=Elysia marginata TaxID=1093978 RepID=A0AAV4JYS3_9GAST|nr:hypothetical protein ElyMa_001732600 [Elysia marginata]
MYVIFLLVLSFLGVLGNTLVLLLHQHDDQDGPARGYSGQQYTADNRGNNCSPPIGSDQSHHKQQAHCKLLPDTTPTDKDFDYSMSTPVLSDARQETLSAHVGAVGKRSRAAQLNRFLLVASAVWLFGCTFAVLMLINLN